MLKSCISVMFPWWVVHHHGYTNVCTTPSPWRYKSRVSPGHIAGTLISSHTNTSCIHLVIQCSAKRKSTITEHNLAQIDWLTSSKITNKSTEEEIEETKTKRRARLHLIPHPVFENTYMYKCQELLKRILAHLLQMSSFQWVGPVAMLNVPGKHKNLQPDSDREDIIFNNNYY